MRKIRKLLALLGRRSYRRGLRFGVGAAIEHASFLRNESFATILDAGANKGQFSLAARAHYPSARIVAFEPLTGPAATYHKLFKNDDRVQLLSIALGSRTGRQTIHLSRRADSSSLLPIGSLQSEVFPGTEEIGTENIEMNTLDAVLADNKLATPVLLKIDVQGFELELLKGAEVSLADIDSVYTELSFVQLYEGQALVDEVISWLSDRDFKLCGVHNMAYGATGRAVQADFHFRKRQVISE